METWSEILFANPIGLLSLFTIFFIIGMGVYLAVFMMRKASGEDSTD
ncbi:MAG: DUF3149 domain-containing protein [Xanthomonadales bacterium]|jgi:hypothetical protein|nr:DUF3149 domain-containing protein [Xanthomonadales bacterium]